MAVQDQLYRSDLEKTQEEEATSPYSTDYEEDKSGRVVQKASDDKSKTSPVPVTGKYTVLPDSRVGFYNFIYRNPGGKTEDKIRSLKTYDEEGALQALHALPIDSGSYPWIKMVVKIDDSNVSGYVHRDIATVLLEEIEVVGSNLSNEYTVIRAKKGANIYDTPNGTVVDQLDFNTEVYVISIDDYNWANIIYKGKAYYINANFLNTGTPMPGIGARLHLIGKGETLERIIDAHFNPSNEEDRRFYANVLIYVNNPQNSANKGIYIDDSIDPLQWLTVDYDRFHIKEGYFVWLPQKAYADALADKVNSGSRSKEFKKKLGQSTKTIEDVVDKYWPVNFGAYYGANVGGTYALLGANESIKTYFFRKDQSTLVLKKYMMGKAGVEAGVGAGFYIGKKGAKNGGPGAGGEAGVNAEAKLGLLTSAVYEFPIHDDDGVASVILAMTNLSEDLKVKAVTFFLDTLAGTQLDPIHYLTKFKLAGFKEAQAEASAGLGIRKAYEDKDQHVATGSKASEYAPKAYETTLLQAVNPLNKKESFFGLVAKHLNISASLLLGGKLTAGVEMENQLKHEEDTVSVEQITMSVFLEAGANFNATLDVPVLGPLGPVFDRALGAKLVFEADMTKEEPTWSSPDFKVYTTSGELDYYDNSASEAELDLNKVKGGFEALGKMDVSGFVTLLRSVRYKKRIRLANMGTKLVKDKKIGQQAEKAGKSKDKGSLNALLDLSAFLDVEIDMSKVDQKQLLDLVSLITGEFKGKTLKEKLWNGFVAVMDWLKNKALDLYNEQDKQDPTLSFMDIMTKIFQLGALSQATFHVRLGAGLALAASAGAGAKLKLFGDVSGGIVAEHDVKDEIVPFLDKNGKLVADIIREQVPDSITGMLDEKIEGLF